MKKKNKKTIRWFLMTLGVIAALLIFLGAGIYLLGWNNLFIRKVSFIIPYPAAVIDGTHWVSFHEYSQKTAMISRYHDLQDLISNFEDYDLSSEEGEKYFQVARKNILNQAIRDNLTEKLAEDRHITVTQEDLAEEIDKIAASSGGQEQLAQKLQQVFQIDLNYFSQSVVKPRLYQKKLRLYLLDQGELSLESNSFETWLNEQTQRTFIFIPLLKYYWDHGQSKVLFRDPSLNQYESSVDGNSLLTGS